MLPEKGSQGGTRYVDPSPSPQGMVHTMESDSLGRGLSENEFVQSLVARGPGGRPIRTTLQTDKRVLARVTDGIYRQPESALRELISNAYDADATEVRIFTDRPRFSMITVQDDGNGMSSQSLGNLIYHIGGSAKRAPRGQALNITGEDRLLSPNKGRRLIGKIGIGLFAVAQLTRRFQIVTKTQGSDCWLVADVVMGQYAEIGEDGDPSDGFETGKVQVWKESTENLDAHGTTIRLLSLRPQVRNVLASATLWGAIDVADADMKPNPPLYHVGRLKEVDQQELRPVPEWSAVRDRGDNPTRQQATVYTALPWDKDDDPLDAFKKLVDAIPASLNSGTRNPSVEKIFDYYLQMAWNLALWSPLQPLSGRLFGEIPASETDLYSLESQDLTVKAVKAQGLPNVSQFEKGSVPNDFRVYLDDLELRRPNLLRFDKSWSSSSVPPELYFGQHEIDLGDKMPAEVSGGRRLKFSAYIYWAPKIIPVEQRGVVVRVNGATGRGFDEAFMNFASGERNRMQQITAEILVTEGFDGALNIDRESFNAAHTHATALTAWLHSALREVIRVNKLRSSNIRKSIRAESRQEGRDALSQMFDEVWRRRSGDPTLEAPQIAFGNGAQGSADRTLLRFPSVATRQQVPDESAEAIAQILSAYGVLDNLPSEDVADLFRDMFAALAIGVSR